MTQSMQKVLDYLKTNSECSYKEIGEATGLPATLVSSAIRILVDKKLIIRHKNFNSTGGAMKNRYEVV